MSDAVRRRSLWPKEHGAYAQLLAPLLAALLVARPTLASLLIAIGACAAFLANEPLLVMLGHRGKRRLDQDGSRARARLIGLVVLAGGAGLAGLAFAPRAALAVAAIAAVPGAITSVLAACSRTCTSRRSATTTFPTESHA